MKEQPKTTTIAQYLVKIEGKKSPPRYVVNVIGVKQVRIYADNDGEALSMSKQAIIAGLSKRCKQRMDKLRLRHKRIQDDFAAKLSAQFNVPVV
jgi:hypothetical protein